MIDALPLLGFLIVIGAFAGVLAGLLGVGGGIVLVPAFFFLFSQLGYGGDQLMQVCLGTSLATIVVTSVRSLQSHNKKGAVDWDLLRAWAPGIAVGAIVGVMAASQLRSVYLQAIFGGLGVVVALYLGLGRPEWRLRDEMPKGIGRAVVSSVLGFLSTLMGIGGGSLGVPTMTLCNMAIHRAVATAAGFGLAIAVPSAPGFMLISVEEASRPPWTIGAVNLPAFAIVICMTLLTTPYGAKLAHAMDPKPLRRVFAVFLFLVALNMLRKAFGWG
ncbi:sulfite exporter TauE/SafE family protein [Shimia abyssi]|uniref:Probable membrane transporter protein n=1 Tax=Shimia abyssi TaxID=1662395 RepID=A0A2P8FAL4_9RHOB|nr:sulfite exporter TauE/SafE family protein [Shimia abyssi]PSL18761.1 putative membrane protein YfcA [Shimia abyssi]